jgi:Complex I intermediate-associated protein 30 (CIA30)
MFLTRVLPQKDLTGATHIAVDASSEQRATVFVSLEERTPGKEGGPRYRAILQLAPGGKSTRQEIPFSEFEADEQAPKDANGKLDLDRIKTISLLDITGLIAPGEPVNTLRVAKIEAIKSENAKSADAEPKK